jgi:hypothetical protein
LKYAQVVKKRKGRKLKKVKKKVVFGEGIEQRAISTSLIERQNLTFRQDNNRVSRKTIGFSKIAKWLVHQMKLYCTHFSATRSYVLNCVNAAPSIWGNPTRICISSNAGV